MQADEAAARMACKAALPGYMAPSTYVRLATWPLNASGKVDRKRLPEPEPGADGCVSGALRCYLLRLSTSACMGFRLPKAEERIFIIDKPQDRRKSPKF